MGFKYYAIWLSVIIAFVFLLQVVLPGFTELFVLDSSKPAQIWRYFSAMFLHGGLGHIAYNLFALVLFGSILERVIGHRKFLLIFLSTGVLANLISINFYTSSLGASGAIFGVIGALIVIRPGLPIWAFGLPMPIFIAGILWGFGDVIGAVSFLTGNPLNNTGNIAHLSGMAFGLLIGWFFRKPIMRKKGNRVVLDERIMRRWEDDYIK